MWISDRKFWSKTTGSDRKVDKNPKGNPIRELIGKLITNKIRKLDKCNPTIVYRISYRISDRRFRSEMNSNRKFLSYSIVSYRNFGLLPPRKKIEQDLQLNQKKQKQKNNKTNCFWKIHTYSEYKQGESVTYKLVEFEDKLTNNHINVNVLGESSQLIWLFIGVSLNITKLRSCPVLPSYLKRGFAFTMNSAHSEQSRGLQINSWWTYKICWSNKIFSMMKTWLQAPIFSHVSLFVI